MTRIVAWLTVPVYLVGLGTTKVLQWRAGVLDDFGEDFALWIGFAAFAVVAAVLVARRPGNPVSWLLAAPVWLLGVFVPAEAWAGYRVVTGRAPDAIGVFGAWGNGWNWFLLLNVVFLWLPLLFPDGRLPSRRWRPLAWLTAALTFALVALGALSETLQGQDVEYVIDNPIGVPALAGIEQSPVFGALGVGFLIAGVGTLISVIVRFRHSQGEERQQLKLFVFAVALIPVLFAGEGLLYNVPLLENVLFMTALLGLPTSIGVAVLRYRLYAIDRIIRRTLTYGLLTALLAGVYALVAVAPSALLGVESNLLVAGATLAAAAAFRPARRRLQTAVDRRFDRSRYDAARVVERFNARLRDQVDLAELNEDLQRVVTAAVQPTHVALWLRR